MATPHPSEDARLQALNAYRILDTPPEEAFDNITALCAELLDAPIVLISLVDDHRQWFKSRVGLDATETPRDIAFCAHAIQQDETLVVEDALADERFSENPLVLGEPGIRFYAGAQLRTPEGHALGTLCAIDRKPREPDPKDIALLQRLAKLVITELGLRAREDRLRSYLDEQVDAQHHKEELAAMVVHDLRNPLGAIVLGASAALESGKGLPSPIAASILESAERAQRMVANVLDICLAQSGELRPHIVPMSVPGALAAVEREMTAVVGKRHVALNVHPAGGEVRADPDLIHRALVNLVENAARYSPAGAEVRIEAEAADGTLRLSVSDRGPGVAEQDRERIFEPGVQANARRGMHGLGLAFCDAAARAHGGRLHFEPNEPGGSRFVLELPA
ncbi:MAG: ATP-binding protein [Planctomycetota bacterium]|nr:ATP-binding protein [Planctomycetota bacterium]